MILTVAAMDMDLKPWIYAMFNLPYIFHSQPGNSPKNRRVRSSTFLKATRTNSQKYNNYVTIQKANISFGHKQAKVLSC